MTTTEDVPRNEWQAYLSGLSRLYQGWAVKIEELAGELGDQPAADGVPLQGLSLETKGSDAGDILIEVGDIGTPYEVHHVQSPRTVRVVTTEPGTETDVEIASEDGTTTLVRIRRRPALPATGAAATAAKGSA